jgi:CubicO group peptidase (beta-lactamase class C family)
VATATTTSWSWLLGEVLERVAQASWAVFLRTHLLQPLGMKATLASPRLSDRNPYPRRSRT